MNLVLQIKEFQEMLGSEKVSGVSEHDDGGDSEGLSDSITIGKRRKRQPKVAPVQNPGEKRYILRQLKVGVTTAKAKSGVDRENKDSSTRAPTSNGGSANFTLEASNNDGADNLMENAAGALSEELNCTPEEDRDYGDADDYRSESRTGGDDDEDSGEESESLQPGEASIGKKLWTFLTT